MNEIHIQYLTNFADRVSVADVFLMNKDDKWEIVAPDFDNIESEIRNQIGDNGFAFIDKFRFDDPQNPPEKTVVYSLGMYGSIIRVENPLWGGYSYLYYLAVNNGTSVLSTDYCAMTMMRFSEDNKLMKDPNWNSGEILVGPCEEFDISQIVDEKWGRQTGDIVFYEMDLK